MTDRQIEELRERAARSYKLAMIFSALGIVLGVIAITISALNILGVFA